jgi:maltose O-acetyltransferase
VPERGRLTWGQIIRRLPEVPGKLVRELDGIHPRLLFANFLLSIFPRLSFGRLRPLVYAVVAGADLGPRSVILGKLDMEGVGDVVGRLHVGERCLFTTPLYLNLNATVFIGDRVVIGHHVVIITDEHDMSDPLYRGGKRSSLPVRIEDGAWVGACATLLPGVTVGRGAVVAAGSVVAKDVPPDTLVGGVPAKVIKKLPT